MLPFRLLLPVLLPALLLASCGPDGNDSSATGTYACYGTTPARNLEFALRLNPAEPRLVWMGDKRLVSKINGPHAYEVHQGTHASQTFDVMQFDATRMTLTHSVVYYVTEEEYASSFGRGDTATASYRQAYNNPHLFSLIPQPPLPQNRVHLGWEKTLWSCKPIASLLYIPYAAQAIVIAILSGA